MTAIHIIIPREAWYERILGFGFILFCAGIASILIDSRFVTVWRESSGMLYIGVVTIGVLSVGLWSTCITVCTVYFAKRWGIISTESGALQVHSVAIPVWCTIALVVWCANYGVRDIQIVLLREMLFKFIPLATLACMVTGFFVRKLLR